MFSNMRYIYKIYKEGSFSKAAKDLYISQPSLSATVKKVEQKIGMPLFERSTNPIQLTECGKQYIKTAEQLMNLEEQFANYVEDLNEYLNRDIQVQVFDVDKEKDRLILSAKEILREKAEEESKNKRVCGGAKST